MVVSAQPVKHTARAGIATLGLVALITLAPLLAVGVTSGGLVGLKGSDWAAIRFTLFQALLSAFFSLALAIPVARALARRSFRGRAVLITLMGAPFIMPVIVAVMGLLAVFGRAGLLSDLLAMAGFERLEIFGLFGVVMAHVFFNLPLAVRFLLGGWQRIPSERLRLAHGLGFDARAMWRHFEWPLLREIAPAAFAAIFLICTTSFAVALILGGGPRATTVELAIYQAFRFEFDLGRAAVLGLAQVLICLLAWVAVAMLALPRDLGAGLDRPLGRWPGVGRRALFLDSAALVLVGAFLILPLVALIVRGVGAVPGLPMLVWEAALRSLILALVSSGLAVGMSLCLAALWLRRPGLVEFGASLSIAVSPLVIGTGLFILLRPWASPDDLALPVTGLINAVVSLPFILRGLAPALRDAVATQARLVQALGLSPWQGWRLAYLPRMRRALGFGAGLAAAFSAGDLGVIALFSLGDTATLPLEMYRLMGSYRTNDAAGAAVVLMGLSLGLFWIFDRWGRAHDRSG